MNRVENLNYKSRLKNIDIGLFIGGLVFLSLVPLIWLGVKNGVFEFLDIGFRQYVIRNIREAGLSTLMEAITNFGDWKIITIICLLCLLRMKAKITIPVVVMSLGSYLINTGLKEVFGRLRPDKADFLVYENGYSFPSGHATTSMALYGFIIFLCLAYHFLGTRSRLYASLLALLIAAIGFSRIYLGVHYPSDVLAGMCEGLGLVFIAASVYKAVVPKEAIEDPYSTFFGRASSGDMGL